LVVVAAIIALCIIAVAFVPKDGVSPVMRLIGFLAVAGMIPVVAVAVFVITIRSNYAQNAEQVKRGSAESGDGQRCPRENGRIEGRDGGA
jgi:hypothetical protein